MLNRSSIHCEETEEETLLSYNTGEHPHAHNVTTHYNPTVLVQQSTQHLLGMVLHDQLRRFATSRSIYYVCIGENTKRFAKLASIRFYQLLL